MRIIVLSPQAARYQQATHKVIVTAADVAAMGAAAGPTALQVFPAAGSTVPAGTRVSSCRFNLVTPFNFTDAAINSLLGSLGDGGDVDRLITDTELAVDGTEILYKSEGAISQPFTYIVPDGIDLTLTAAGGGSPLLSETDVGELEIYLNVQTEDDLERPRGGGGNVTI